jgi:L,D-peptidoglycan transpeptidase YkuD (ErfK/YbiS/YcfS/YnhG family)
MTRGVFTAVIALLALTASASGSGRTTLQQSVAKFDTTCADTLANQLASTRSATQLVTVMAANGRSTQATLRLWRKSGECWIPVGGPSKAWLGGRGVSENRREGDRTTPAGAYGFQRTMYGVGPNPGVRYAYRRIVCGDWWVEDPRSAYYNRFRHVRCGANPPFRVTSNDMSRSPTAYRHLAVIDFNTHPVVPGRGSGIFLHVSTGRPTLGCISLPRAQLVTVLRWLRPEAKPLIVIGTEAKIRRY